MPLDAITPLPMDTPAMLMLAAALMPPRFDDAAVHAITR